MTNHHQVYLRHGKERTVGQRHPWIFSGAVKSIPQSLDGALVSVCNSNGMVLGSGFASTQGSIAVRMVSHGPTPPLEAIGLSLQRAIALRRDLIPESTTARRLINAEGDGLPGLIVDQFSGILVVQILSKGFDLIREWLIERLVALVQPLAILERSSGSSRAREGLEDCQQVLYGHVPDEVIITENGVHYAVNLHTGQKTGFFLDQREMRQWIGELSAGKRVLDAFSYAGGFALSAVKGGAEHVTAVDISKRTPAFIARNAELNGVEKEKIEVVTADVMEFLDTDPLHYNVVILDPPAFAKRRKDVAAAIRGYRELNRRAFEKVRPNALVATFSCSAHVDAASFTAAVQQAARAAGREVQIIGDHRLAVDHPIALCHPEGRYLKGLVVRVGNK